MGRAVLSSPGVRISDAMPLSRIAFERRAKSNNSARLWASVNIPRWLTMRLKLSSWLSPSHILSEVS